MIASVRRVAPNPVFLAVVALAVVAATAAPVRAGEDLAERYPATMTWSESGLSWECGAEDVWSFASFEVSQGSQLEITAKKATAVLGRHGTNVLWAVVFPEKPAKIRSKLAGDREETDAILLRFSPAELGRIFPEKTVRGPGPPWRRGRAMAIFRHKLGWKWSTPSGSPTIVPEGFVIVDADTDAGARRFWGVNATSGSVEYVADFEGQPVPPPTPIRKGAAQVACDEVWEAFDREYAGFVLLPGVDWERLGKQYRKVAGQVDTTEDLGAVIADLLAHLEDLHVWVKVGEAWMPGYTRERPLNGNWQASQAEAGDVRKLGENVHFGRTADGIGYLNVSGLSDLEITAHADAALEELADTWALVLDLRFNGGGDELLARSVAARFVDEARVYSKNRYRDGSAHDALGPIRDRTFEPRGPWRYESPVVCLQGRRTMSSAESFALMMAQCPQAVTMGDPTAGSSGNPRRLELDCGITVNMPRWLDMDPDENPIEHVGAAPDVPVACEPADFSATSDPVFAAALERLRAIPTAERQPGRR